MTDHATRVLVVDDEPDVLVYLSTFLEDEGFVVATAPDGPSALATAAADPPDVITLDVNMPGMSGFEVLARLRRDPDLNPIPVVIVTGVAKLDSAASFRDGRAPEAFMQKPVDVEVLATTLLRLTETAG